MSKDLVFCMAQPDDMLFAWQIETQIYNFRKYGLSDKMRYLMFLPSDRLEKGWNKETRELAIKYPEVQFFWYEDTEGILELYVNPYQYIPLLRPYCLAKHFKQYPELTEKAIFYMDADVIFIKDPTEWIEKYKDDDICYLSDTKSYIGASYWDSKVKDVREDKLEDYKLIDPLDIMAKQIGITGNVCRTREEGSGGAQYLLKNIDSIFWLDVFRGCLNIRAGLSAHVPGSINATYFADENKGFQSWCCDMWSVLWNLWKRDMVTICPPEMNFAWATSPFTHSEGKYIMHNAGVTQDTPMMMDGELHKLFFKSAKQYVNNITTPFNDLGHKGVSTKYCSSIYCEAIEEARVGREFSITFNN